MTIPLFIGADMHPRDNDAVALWLQASVTDATQRSRVVSAYMFQVTTLSIVGKALFPIVDWLLLHAVGITDNLLRMRVHMAECTFFCFFGFAKLVSAGQSGNITAAPKSVTAGGVRDDAVCRGIDALSDAVQTELDDIHDNNSTTSSDAEAAPAPAAGSPSLYAFGLLATVLMLQSFSSSVGNILWSV